MYNDEFVHLILETESTTFPTTFTAYSSALIPEDLRPEHSQYPVFYHEGNDAVIKINADDGYVYRKTLNSSAMTTSLYLDCIWKKQ